MRTPLAKWIFPTALLLAALLAGAVGQLTVLRSRYAELAAIKAVK